MAAHKSRDAHKQRNEERRHITIAIAGNPNCGKTTVFNALTGSDQKVGNWPGVTVEKKEGSFHLESVEGKIIDLPGIYSLSPDSEDELVARRFLADKQYDMVINVVDASNLERNLYLTTQLLEMNIPVCVVFNKADLAKKNGISMDMEKLKKAFGVPLIGISAVEQGDISSLKEHLDTHLVLDTTGSTSRERQKHHLHISYPEVVENFIREVEASPLMAKESGFQHIGARSMVSGLLEGDQVISSLIEQFDADIYAKLLEEAAKVKASLEDDADIVLAESRYAAIQQVQSMVKRSGGPLRRKFSLDDVMMHRFWGIPIFFGVMYLVFWVTMTVGGAFIDFFDILFGAVFVDGLGALLGLVNSPDWLITALAGGVGGGIQTIATFIPIIFFMFLMLGILEDSGYMARAAFVMDRFMRFVGLPGKAFVPMLVGFGCTVPAILATRTLESRRDRFLTIFMTPFMSCGARLPVYALFAAAFFPRNSGFIVFSIYMAGIILAIFTGLILKHTLFKGEFSPFIMELPSYNMPRFLKVMRYSWDRLKIFMFRAGKVIIVVVFVLTLLNSWGLDGSFGNEDTSSSVLSGIGKSIVPIFEPMGLQEDNWPAAVGLFTGIFAKEAVVGTLNSLYIAEGSLGSGGRSVVSADADGKAEPYRFFPYIAEAFTALWQNLLEMGSALLDPFGFGMISGEEASVAEEVEADSSVFSILRSYFTQASAYAYMLFVLIYFPCVAALGAVFREAGKFYGVLVASYLTLLAWVVSTLFYQIAEGHSLLWIAAALVLWGLIYLTLFIMGYRHKDGRYEAAQVW